MVAELAQHDVAAAFQVQAAFEQARAGVLGVG